MNFKPLNLDEACTLGDLPSIEASLLSNPSAINCQDCKMGWTPLFRAVFSGNIPVVEYLLDHGANPDIGIHKGASPLHQAVDKGLYPIAKLLLKHHALQAGCHGYRRKSAFPLPQWRPKWKDQDPNCGQWLRSFCPKHPAIRCVV